MARVSYEFMNEGGEVVRIVDAPNTLRITESGVGHCESELGNFSPEVQRVFAWHGMKQKFGDELAGKESTIADVVALRDRLLSMSIEGWHSGREGGGGLLAIAVHRCKPDKFATVADAARRISQLTDEQVRALGRDSVVADMIDQIRKERRAATMTAGLIDSL